MSLGRRSAAVFGLVSIVGGAALGALTMPANELGFVASLGRSLGGGRVIVEDALFLRAEALHRQGRVEEIPVLYETVLRLDPDNAPAAVFLAGVYAYDLLAAAPDPDARFAWWEAAWNTTERALRGTPDEPSLLVRSADLLIDVPARYPEIAARVRDLLGDPELIGLRRLLSAARRTDVLPRRGRAHLRVLAQALPVIAAGRLGEDRVTADRVLAIGDEVLRARADVLARMQWDWETAEGGVSSVPLTRVLTEGLALVRGVRADLEEGRRAGARLRIEAFERAIPGSALPDVLRGGLENR